MKQNLNEQIARIKRLLALNESTVIEETEQLDEQLGEFIKKIVPALERKFISGIEGKLGKKIAQASDAEIGNAFKSAELAVLRKEIAAAVYASEKTMIDDVFSKYNMSVAGDAQAAYRELQSKGLNKSILRDVASEWKAAGKGGTSAASKPAASATAAPATAPAKFSVPNVEVELKNVDLFDSDATYARLKNLFPKAPSGDIQKMVNNLKKSKLLTQQEFDKAYAEAVKGYGPQYAEVLNKTPLRTQAANLYKSLSNWQKNLFWIAIGLPGGYTLLKGLGIPVDDATGMIVRKYKEMLKDQGESLKGKKTKTDDSTTDDSQSGDNVDWSKYKPQGN